MKNQASIRLLGSCLYKVIDGEKGEMYYYIKLCIKIHLDL